MDRTTPTDTMRLVAWHHFRFHIPADWEATAYSVEPRAGRIEFSTRAGFQGAVDWEPCRCPPDAQTLMTAFLRRHVVGIEDLPKRATEALTLREIAGFTAGWLGEALPFQALRFLPAERTLLRWSFPRCDERLVADLFEPILRSFVPNDGDLRVVALFGLRFEIPAHFELEDMVVLPANVMLAFEGKDKVRATFRRWGMPEVVLGGRSLESFYPWLLRAVEAAVSEVKPATILGFPGVAVRFSQRGSHQMDRFLSRLWTGGQGLLWHDTRERRLVSFEQIGPPGARLLDPAAVLKRDDGLANLLVVRP